MLVYSLPFIKSFDSGLDKISDVLPIHFSSEALFMSHWLDEGSNPSPKGMNIHQTHSVSIPILEHSIGYEYFYGAFEDAKPHTLDQGHTIFAELKFGILTIKPMWTYVDVPQSEEEEEDETVSDGLDIDPEAGLEEPDGDEDDDSGEIGMELSLNTFLNPSFAFNYDYKKEKGYYFEWGISHEFDLIKMGKLVPSMSFGLNSRKGIEHTLPTHIDWGVDYIFPIGAHMSVKGFVHITKGLKHEEGFEDIVPWGGFGLNFEI